MAGIVIDSDKTFEEFWETVHTYGLLRGPGANERARLLNQVLEAIAARGDEGLSFDDLAHITGTGMVPGVFYAFVRWLTDHGVMIGQASEASLFLHPVSADLLACFRAYSHSPERWQALAEKETLEFPDDDE